MLVGLAQIVFNGWGHYRRGVREPGLLDKYGKGCPNDLPERLLFTKLSVTGVFFLLLLDLYLLGFAWGAGVWVAQIIWTPFLGGLVNGVGHVWGYRNYDVKDHSRNFFPFGLLLGGEELHNNHHSDPRSARFRRRWFEFDVGWIYITILSWMGLAKIEHAGNRRGETRLRLERKSACLCANSMSFPMMPGCGSSRLTGRSVATKGTRSWTGWTSS